MVVETCSCLDTGNDRKGTSMKQLVLKFDKISTSENQIEIASNNLKIPGPQRTQGVHLHTTFILTEKVRLRTNDIKFFFNFPANGSLCWIIHRLLYKSMVAHELPYSASQRLSTIRLALTKWGHKVTKNLISGHLLTFWYRLQRFNFLWWFRSLWLTYQQLAAFYMAYFQWFYFNLAKCKLRLILVH